MTVDSVHFEMKKTGLTCQSTINIKRDAMNVNKNNQIGRATSIVSVSRYYRQSEK